MCQPPWLAKNEQGLGQTSTVAMQYFKACHTCRASTRDPESSSGMLHCGILSR